MSAVVQCESCGGSVVYDAAIEASRCIFCGSTKMGVPEEGPDEIPQPDAALTLGIDQADADGQYRDWAKSSWWNPKELRSLSIQLQLMYIPAWWIRGEVESHWSGLVRAPTKSGKRPTSGISKGVFEDMVPASQGLSEEELAELHPFRMDEQDDWGSVNQEIPYEVPALSEQAARIWVHDRLTNQHLAVILNEEGLLSGVSSAQVQEEAHKLFMLPVYIGAFQFRERPWRFVINAQTGEVVGDPPVDWKKVFFVAAGVLLVGSLIVAAML